MPAMEWANHFRMWFREGISKHPVRMSSHGIAGLLQDCRFLLSVVHPFHNLVYAGAADAKFFCRRCCPMLAEMIKDSLSAELKSSHRCWVLLTQSILLPLTISLGLSFLSFPRSAMGSSSRSDSKPSSH